MGFQIIIMLLLSCNTNVVFKGLHSLQLKIELSLHSLSSQKPPGSNVTFSVDIIKVGTKSPT